MFRLVTTLLIVLLVTSVSVFGGDLPEVSERSTSASGNHSGSTTETPTRQTTKLLTQNMTTTTTTSPTKKETPSPFESRMGREAASAPVQSHRSNVATYSGGSTSSASGVRPSPSRIGSAATRPQAALGDATNSISSSTPLDVSEIRCMKMASRERFSAVISTPEGLQGAAPVFEDRPTVDPITSRVCQIQPTERANTFRLEVSNLDACGVKSCNQDGQPWLCLTLRFPVLTGLKLPEDEIVEIRCKQQDRTVAERKDIDFDGDGMSSFSPRVEQKSPVTFTGGRQEFLCEIGLFRRLPGTVLFSQRIGPGTAVELGEEVQLRSIVRSNDGWFYSKMTDVVVRRLKRQTVASGSEGSASLVLPDGCRNPAYRAIATQHPQRDSRSSLLNNFNFRVFLFQDMDDGDSIVISARVIACVEAIDCSPTLCADDRGQGSGRRKRRSNWTNGTGFADGDDASIDVSGKTREILIEQRIFPNGTVAPASAHHLRGWESDLALRVAMPGEYYAGTRATPLGSLEAHCFLYLMLTVGLATALGVTALLVSIYCICTCRKRRGCNDSKPSLVHSAPSAITEIAKPNPLMMETLMMEACYPELQMLDALSRSVRQKKQSVHEEIVKLYGASPAERSVSPTNNVYSNEPGRPSLKQIKRHRMMMQQQQSQMERAGQNVTTVVVGPDQPIRNRSEEALYWEIGHQQQLLPPTPV